MVSEIANSIIANSSAATQLSPPGPTLLAQNELAGQITKDIQLNPEHKATMKTTVPFQVAAGEPAIKPLPKSSPEHLAVVAANKKVEIYEAALSRAEATYKQFSDLSLSDSVAGIDLKRVELHFLNAQINLHEAKLEQYSARADYKITAGVGEYASVEDRALAYNFDTMANEVKTYENVLIPLTQKAKLLSKEIADLATVAQKNDDLVPVTLTEEADSRSDWAAASIKATDTFHAYKNVYANYTQAKSQLETAGLKPISTTTSEPQKTSSGTVSTEQPDSTGADSSPALPGPMSVEDLAASLIPSYALINSLLPESE